MSDILIKLAEISAVQKQQTEALEKYAEIQTKQNEILLRNTITVEEHHKRSLYLEAEQQKLEAQIEPIKAHVEQIRGIGNFIKWSSSIVGLLVTLGGVIWGAIKLLFWVKGIGL